MKISTTIYRFQIELSDVERSLYETLEFRIAQHPSEALSYLLTRVIAYALNYSEELSFSQTGLCDPDAAALSVPEKLLIEIGSPSARKLHKGLKAADSVKVYTYKNPELLLQELRQEKIHRVEELELYSLNPAFLEELAVELKRDNRWGLLVNEGELSVQVGERMVSGFLSRHFL